MCVSSVTLTREPERGQGSSGTQHTKGPKPRAAPPFPRTEDGHSQPLQHHLFPFLLVLQDLGGAEGELLLFSVQNYDQLVQKELLHGNSELQALCCKRASFHANWSTERTDYICNK